MGATQRVVLNAEKEGDPKAGLPRGYPFFRMLQRLGAVVPGAPIPVGPTLHDRLAALEEQASRDAGATAASVAALQEGIARIERQLRPEEADDRLAGDD